MAPMAGACPVPLAAAVANAGGMGGIGALLNGPDAIAAWAKEFREGSNGGFQANLWIPDPPPKRDKAHEARVREFLERWGPAVAEAAGGAPLVDFYAACDSLLAPAPRGVSSVMGLFPEKIVRASHADRDALFFCAPTPAQRR